MTDYTPVDCGLHSKYELAIMHRQALRLTWRNSKGEVRSETVLPEDLRTRQHEEFLLVSRADRKAEEIRLDHILHFEHA